MDVPPRQAIMEFLEQIDMSREEAVVHLWQCMFIVIMLIAAHQLYIVGAFDLITSYRSTVSAMILVVCEPNELASLKDFIRRRGIEESKRNDEQLQKVGRGEQFTLHCGSRKLAGAVLEDGQPRATTRVKEEWEGRLNGLPYSVHLVEIGQCVVANYINRSNMTDKFAMWRLTRFLRRACKRRASLTELPRAYFHFFSPKNKRILSVVPISPTFASRLERKLPAFESAKSK